MTSKLFTLSALCFAFGAALSGAAHAAEEMDNAPASLCVPVEGSNLTVNASGLLVNKSAAAASAVCPTARKVVGGSFTSHYRATVWAVDEHPSQNVCCRTYTKNPGGAVKEGAQVCTSGTSTTYQTLELPEVVDGYTWSHFFVQCTVPPAYGTAYSRLVTFRSVQE